MLGQANFTNANLLPVGPGSFFSPGDVHPTTEGIFVTDTAYDRVVLLSLLLGYHSQKLNFFFFFCYKKLFFPAKNTSVAANATAVYGQPDVNTFISGVSAQRKFNPFSGVVGPGGTILVSDSDNNRILMFPPFPPTPSAGSSAIDVFGQSSLSGSGTAQLNSPYLIAYDELYGCLWVADEGNNRIVKYCDISNPPTEQTNISSVDVQVTFPYRSPTVILSPKGKC